MAFGDRDRLESWKEISAYLRRDARTVHRWERDEGLPVHRHLHKQRGTVYAYRAELDEWRSGRAPKPRRAPEGGRRIMLAILPFENLSGAAGDGYFSDGLTEDLIAHLGRTRADDLGVIARTSVMAYKGGRKTIREIGRELGIDYALEGSVRRAADHVRVTAQLIRVRDQTHVWADSYDRDLKDILALQSELAAAVAERIGIKLPRHHAAGSSRREVDPGAFEAYLKGRFHWYKLTADHLDLALEYFHLALEKDPTYALAYEGIAGVWLMRGDVGVLPPGETLLKAKSSALKALQLDDSLAEVHVTLGNIKFGEWDWDGAEHEFQRAIELNPSSADARLFYADFLISMRRIEEAAREMDRALELDPFNSFLRCFSGWHHVYLGRYDAAVAALKRAINLEPHFPSAHLGLWGAYAGSARFEEALAAARSFFQALRDREVVDVLDEGSGAAGYRRAMLRAADVLAARARSAHVSAVRVARLFAQGGDGDRAIEWLERSYDRRESPLVHLNVGWDWQALRSDPRLASLVERIGFPVDRCAAGATVGRSRQ